MIKFLTMNTLPLPEDMAAIFRARGIPYTPQRRAVWTFFVEHPQGHTISAAVDALLQAHIGQATVYRTVFLLLDMGLLRRIQDDVSGKAYFVAVRPGHSHPLICRQCRAIVEFDSCDLTILERLLARETGYIIERHHLEVYGVCPTCRMPDHATPAQETACIS
ncbi:MAG TPA: Fur family transcriptional regulator [Armatimonadota bacterium]|jgi:Fe2+ or Zn2+ uptake regulation protein